MREEVELYGIENIPIILVGTKSDLPPAVDPAVARKYADSNRFPLVECSAKTGAGVNEVFEKAIIKIGLSALCTDWGIFYNY